MFLIFYGQHSKQWMQMLNDKLLVDLQPTITRIENCATYHDKLSTADLIIPLMEHHMLDLYKHNIPACMPDQKTILIFMCKKKFAEYVSLHGLDSYTPKTYHRLADCVGQTLIVKPPNLNAGSGAYITNTVIESGFEKGAFRAFSSSVFKTHIVQEYIFSNVEYCAYVVADKGLIQYICVYQTTFDSDKFIKRGVDAKMVANMKKIDLDKKFIDIIQLFLLPVSYTGVCNIDFKIINDNIKIFEINPRLGGGLMFDIHKCDLIGIILTMVKVFKN